MENTEVTEVSVIDQALEKENVTAKVLASLKEKYLPLKIASIDDAVAIKAVEDAKKECSRLRNLAVSICKHGREESIRIQKAWIAKEKEVAGAIAEVEDHLKSELKRIDDIREKALAEAAARMKLPIRQEKLATIGVTIDEAKLLELSDTDFIALFNDLHQKQLAEREAKIREQEEKIAAEKAEAERKERERLAEEQRQREIAEAEGRARKAARAEQLRPYIMFIRDYTAMIELPEEEYQKSFAEIHQGAIDHYQHEAKVNAEREAAEALQREKEARAKAELEAKINGRANRLLALGLSCGLLGSFIDEHGVVCIPKSDLYNLSDEAFNDLVKRSVDALNEDKIAREEHAKLQAQEEREAAERAEKEREEREAEERREQLRRRSDADKWTAFMEELDALRSKYNRDCFTSEDFKFYQNIASSHIDQIKALNTK